MAIQDTLNVIEREALGVIERQDWLEPISDVVQKAVSGAFGAGGTAGGVVEDFLNGVWLGHTLHPVLVEVPVGAWTATLVLDALDASSRNDTFAAGADATVSIGLMGALAAVVTGLSQWQYTVGGTRRKGMLHALLNVGATGLYVTSLVQRMVGARSAGRVTALMGYAVVTVSSYIGGDLVYGDLLGVNHAPQDPLPNDFVAVLAEAELPEGGMKRVEAGGVLVLLAKQHGAVYAMADLCSHMGGPLSEGTLKEGCVMCPWHSSQFALADGHVITGPATYPQPSYEVRTRNGQIEVRNRSQLAR